MHLQTPNNILQKIARISLKAHDNFQNLLGCNRTIFKQTTMVIKDINGFFLNN